MNRKYSVRKIKEKLGLLLFRAAIVISGIFLVMFAVMIILRGGSVFIKTCAVNEIADNYRLRNVIIKNGVIIDNKKYDLSINGKIIKGLLKKGMASDIEIKDDIINEMKILNLQADRIENSYARINTGKSAIDTGNPELLKNIQFCIIEGAAAELVEASEYIMSGGVEITKIKTNLVFTGGFLENISIKNGIIRKMKLVKPLRRFSLHFIFASPEAGMTAGGIFPALIGTFYLTIMAMLLAFPIGVLAAIYLNEYAWPPRAVQIIRTAINTLAGVPSIVYGLFGMAVFVNFLAFQVSILSGALTLAVLVLPIIINASEEALKTVPREMREASLGLGATKRQMIMTVVLPAALPNILTGAIIAVGRAAGETAPILFTAAAFYFPGLPESIFSPCMALPYQIYALMTEGTARVQTSIAYGASIVLLLLVLAINSSAIILRGIIRKKRQW